MSESTARSSWFSDFLSRAAQSVGVLTILATIIVFGVAEMLLSISSALKLSVLFFGVVGFSEVFIRQAKSSINSRLERAQELYLGVKGLPPNSMARLEVRSDFTHEGLCFHYLGFPGQPAALAVSTPLCPSCKSHLVERAKFSYYRYVVEFACPCGYRLISKRTGAELMMELMQLRPSEF